MCKTSHSNTDHRKLQDIDTQDAESKSRFSFINIKDKCSIVVTKSVRQKGTDPKHQKRSRWHNYNQIVIQGVVKHWFLRTIIKLKARHKSKWGLFKHTNIFSSLEKFWNDNGTPIFYFNILTWSLAKLCHRPVCTAVLYSFMLVTNISLSTALKTVSKGNGLHKLWILAVITPISH